MLATLPPQLSIEQATKIIQQDRGWIPVRIESQTK